MVTSTSTANQALRRSASRRTNQYVPATPISAQTASGSRPAHSCKPKARNPSAIEVKGSSPRPSSLRVGTSLSAPSRDSPCPPSRLSAIRRANSATSRSGGSQTPLDEIGANRLSASTSKAKPAKKPCRLAAPAETAGNPLLFSGISAATAAEPPVFSSLIAACALGGTTRPVVCWLGSRSSGVGMSHEKNRRDRGLLPYKTRCSLHAVARRPGAWEQSFADPCPQRSAGARLPRVSCRCNRGETVEGVRGAAPIAPLSVLARRAPPDTNTHAFWNHCHRGALERREVDVLEFRPG